MLRLRGNVIGIIVVASCSLCPAGTLVVDLDGGGDFSDIQSGLNTAADGDTVLVFPGEYVVAEPLDINPFHRWDDSSSPPVKNVQLISLLGAGETIIRMAAVAATSSRCVMQFRSNEDGRTIIEGFSFVGGTGINGFGMMLHFGSPIVSKCCFVGNEGGGIWCWAGFPEFISCQISSNEGDAVLGYECAYPTLIGCSIVGNGGGVGMMDGGGVRIRESTISENGTGVWCASFGSASLENCIIAKNSVGVASMVSSTVTLRECSLFDNRQFGALCDEGILSFSSCTFTRNKEGILCVDPGRTYLHRCLVVHSLTHGVACWNSSAVITNCTFVANGGWAVASSDEPQGPPSSLTITNSILWGNALGAVTSEEGSWPAVAVTYSCIQNPCAALGGNNLRDIAPRFVSESSFVLGADSPCIDSGDPSSPLDPDGTPADIGAYSFLQSRFVRGDANGDACLDIGDAVVMLFVLFDRSQIECADAFDANDDGSMTLVDPILILRNIFLGGVQPAAPFPSCGADRNMDRYVCVGRTGCL